MDKTVHTAVIGAGLTGLTTAFYLEKENIDFVVLEKENRIGGVIRTRSENGFIIEEGPNTGVLKEPEVAMLFDDLDGACNCETASEKVKKRYILKNGKWEPLPMNPLQAFKTPLFTGRDKFRLLGEPFRRKGDDPLETLDKMVKRRMGESFLNFAVDPFILGVYAGDPAALVTKYALPKLYNLEQNYGSFIGGAFKKKFEKKDHIEKKATKKVFSVRGGLSHLTENLYRSAGKSRFLLNVEDITITPGDDFFVIKGYIENEKITIRARNVLTTTGSYTLPGMLPFVQGEVMERIKKMDHAPVIQIGIGFDKWQGRKLDGFGGLIPFSEKRDILGVLFISSLLLRRAPTGGALLSVFAGGTRRPGIYQKSDSEIESLVEKEFCSLMEVKEFNPSMFRIFRYRYAIPQYGRESVQKLEALEILQKRYKGLIIGGNLRDGIGMADRIKQGRQLADKIRKM